MLGICQHSDLKQKYFSNTTNTMFLSYLVYVAGLFLALFMTLCLACGLFYIAEWMEENTEKTKRVFKIIIYCQIAGLAFVWMFDGLPFFRIAFSIGCHYVYSLLLNDFPVTDFSNPILILSAGTSY